MNFTLCQILISLLSFLPLSIVTNGIEDPLISDFNRGVGAMKEEGNYNRALHTLLEFTRSAEKNPDKYDHELMRAYCYIGIIYGSYDDFTLSCEYSRKGLEAATRLNDSRYKTALIYNLANGLTGLGKYDEARIYAEMLIADSPADRDTFNYQTLIGSISMSEGRPDLARLSYDEAEDIARKNNYSDYERACIAASIAKCYEPLNQPDSQAKFLSKAYLLASLQSRPEPKLEAARLLMKFHTLHSAPDSALLYQEKYFAMADSLMSISDFLKIKSNNELKTIGEKEEKIEGLSWRISMQYVIILIITIALIVVTAMLITIIKQKKTINSAYKAIFDRNMELVKLEDSLETNNQQTPTNLSDTKSPADYSDNDLFAEIKQIMESEKPYLDPGFSLPALTSMVKSNTSYVSKVIAAHTGQNVRSFINEYRVKEARRRISDTTNYGHMTIQAIGESVGYNTQVNFNRAFKKVTGITPSIYLALAMKEDSDASFPAK